MSTEFHKNNWCIPQRVQELCLMFAQICYKNHNDIVNTEWIDESISRWIKTSLNKNYVFVSRLLKYESKSESFRNQVLYCLAQKDKLFFPSSEIDEDLRLEFPNSQRNRKITSTRELNQLCSFAPPLLEKTSKNINEYSFVDFKFALCLRVTLTKENEKVKKNNIYDI